MGTAKQPTWTGDQNLPLHRQGLTVLGTPLGTPQYVEQELRDVETKHETLVERILLMEDLQAAWLLLSL